MSETLLWVIGSGGLLGSHLRRALYQHVPKARIWESAPPHFSWTDPIRLTEELSHAVATFASDVRETGNTWAVLWCAGRGVVSSSVAELEPEWSAWTLLLDLLSRYLTEPSDDVPGRSSWPARPVAFTAAASATC